MREILNTILFLLRCLFPNNERILFFKVIPLSEDRFKVIEERLESNKLILDIGCGDNRLVKRYRMRGGKGYGLDITPNPSADMEVEQSSKLDFSDNTFDYITFIAAINHIPTREETLKEAYRCLKPKGKIFITNLTPMIGHIGHTIWAILGNDPDLGQRKKQAGEKYGLKSNYIAKLLKETGFVNIKHKRFSLGLNNLFIASKP